MAEWSIATDCKSVGLWPTKVRILPDAKLNEVQFCAGAKHLRVLRKDSKRFSHIRRRRIWETCTGPVRTVNPFPSEKLKQLLLRSGFLFCVNSRGDYFSFRFFGIVFPADYLR